MGMERHQSGNLTMSLIRTIAAATLSLALILSPMASAQAAPARIKDIVDMEGVRENQLVGYGLVVGLNGTGDSLNNSPFTKQ
jgi:flagellar P-ring protein FlgI